jgi:hypothetical protein
MMGHKINLDSVYFTPTREELFAEFVKAIPELTIDGATRKQAELEQKEKENTELQKEISNNKSLQIEVEKMKKKAELDRIDNDRKLERFEERFFEKLKSCEYSKKK